MEFLLALGKRLFGNTPLLKKCLKYLTRGLVARYDRAQSKQYQALLKPYILSKAELQAQAEEAKRLAYRPLISLIVPTYNTPEAYFRQMYASVLAQTYDNWELVIVDDASTNETVRKMIRECAESEPRMRYKFLDQNLQIAGATNEAIALAKGEFVALFDHDDILWPNALYETAKVLNGREADLVYTDEDKIAGDTSQPMQPLFKPDWNPDFLRSVNYITHFTTIRKSVLDTHGYEDGEYNGAQDWELFLRLTRVIPAERVCHIPKILYSWRVHAESTANLIEAKPYVAAAQRKALEGDLEARGYHTGRVVQDDLYSAQWQLHFSVGANPDTTVIVQNNANINNLRKHLSAQGQSAAYDIIETSPNMSLGQAIKNAKGEYVVIIDREVHVSDVSWLETMQGDAMRDDIGFVLAECSEQEVMWNLEDILQPDIVAFLGRVNRRFGTKHLYLTARYNIASIHGGIVMAQTKKLRLLEGEKSVESVHELSQAFVKKGYRNLYNPYVRVLK